jgi:Phage integrase family
MLNLTRLHLGIAHESQFQRLGISRPRHPLHVSNQCPEPAHACKCDGCAELDPRNPTTGDAGCCARAASGYAAAAPPSSVMKSRRGLPWLFVSERQSKLTRFAVNYLLDRTAKLAGFDDLHPHCLRHSCGYALADKGVDLRTIQEWLGHRSIEMTIRYTRISQRRFNGLWR